MRNPGHFDRLGAAYAAARPPYPPQLWRDVLASGLVGPGRRALDLGAGTGEATGELLARGTDVVAVEPGPRFAAILAERFPTVVVVASRAEDLRPATGAFDLVVAATSIHWLDLGVVLPIVHRCLTADGRLLVWRTVFGDARAEVTPFRREVQRIVDRRGGPPARVGPDPEDVEPTVTALTRTGLFSLERTSTHRWSTDLTTDKVRRLFTTFSDWTADEVEQAATTVDSLGGTVREHYTSWLIVAEPRR